MISIRYYPRSGSSLLATYISQSFGLKNGDEIIKNNTNSSTVLGDEVAIIRNPFESISSIIAMESNFYSDRTIKQVADNRVKDYIEFYNYFINDFAGPIYSYDALISVPHKILDDIESRFNLTNIRKHRLLHNLVVDNKKDNHVASSLSLSNFKEAKTLLRDYDLSECFRLYRLAYDKAII